jgi:hypothetical protein
MLWTDAGGEMAMGPWAVEVVMVIVGSAVMADPAIIFGMYVWSIGMTWLVAVHGTIVIAATIWSSGMIVAATNMSGRCGSYRGAAVIRGTAAAGSCLMRWRRLWPVRWNVSVANPAVSSGVRLCGLGLAATRLTTVLRLLGKDKD